MFEYKTLSALKKECEARGIWPPKPTGRGGSYGRRDYIDTLARDSISKFEGRVPNNLYYRLDFESVMLASLYSNLNDAEQLAIWESDDWVLTEKVDGVRALLIYSREEGMSLYSRGISDETFLPVDYAQNFYNRINSGKVDGFCLDVEIVLNANKQKVRKFFTGKDGYTLPYGKHGKYIIDFILSLDKEESINVQSYFENATQEPLLELKLLDVISYASVDVKSLPYGERMVGYFNMVISHLKDIGLRITPNLSCRRSSEKRRFHAEILDKGGEGTVAMNVHAPYMAVPRRSKSVCVKIKKFAGNLSGKLPDSVDGFITGYELADRSSANYGKVGAVLVSVILQTTEGDEVDHVIARVADMSDTIRDALTDVVDGKVQLNSLYMGSVVEIKGKSISRGLRRLAAPRLLRFRDDKSRYDCVMSEDTLGGLAW